MMNMPMHLRHTAIVAALVAAAGALFHASLRAQQAPAWNGTYTAAQAARGQTLYAENCTACHGTGLAGGDRAPALTGGPFFSRWSSMPIGTLLDYIHAQMPLQSPGGLSRQQSADILAFILRQGGMTPGAGELAGTMSPAPPRPATTSALPRQSFFTADQALRGKTAFDRNCAYCHSVDAKLWSAENNATIMPRTFGGRFIERVWHGHMLYPTVYHLYRKMESMPAFDTKGITAQTRADILAYILQNNDLPAGPNELTTNTSLMKSMMLNEPGFESLFNGKDFTGFKFVIGPNCTPAPAGCGKTEPGTVLRVEDGEIRCVCNVHGYFYWDKPYQNFTFRFEQKFERPADWDAGDPLFFGGTGALIFIQPPHRAFPRSIEIEGRYFDLGEPFPIGGKGTITYDHAARLKAGRPLGEWDAVEIVSQGGTVRTSINGTLVSTVSAHDYPAGPIGMQTEGAPVSWRNLRVRTD